jgi:hypothetical protein
MAQPIRYPYAEGRCLEEHGLMRARCGEREHLDPAVTIFRQLGARLDLERTAQALRDLA